ncbi:testicular acid phosphatase homolog [Haemaphysalis longicornis]
MRIGLPLFLVLALQGGVPALAGFQGPTGAAASGRAQLVHVAVIFRHGDRAPLTSFHGDPNRGYVWPMGRGQLTTRGRRTMWVLGKWLRRRYGHFLSWDVREVVARSSPVPRCYDSVALLLYGLYPAHGEQRKWNHRQDWQPVPITTLPDGTDKYTAICKKRMQQTAVEFFELKVPPGLMATSSTRSRKAREVLATVGDVFTYVARMANVTEKSGLPRFFVVARVLDALFVVREYNMPVPEWAGRQLKLLEWTNTKLVEGIARFQMDNMAGVMLKDVVARLRFGDVKGLSLTQGKDDTTPSQKITLLSYHDMNVAGVLLGFNYTLSTRPPYGAAVMLEAFTRSGDAKPQVYVRVLLKAGNKVTNLAIDGCDEPCTIERFDNFLHRKFHPVSRAQCQWSEQQPLL